VVESVPGILCFLIHAMNHECLGEFHRHVIGATGLGSAEDGLKADWHLEQGPGSATARSRNLSSFHSSLHFHGKRQPQTVIFSRPAVATLWLSGNHRSHIHSRHSEAGSIRCAALDVFAQSSCAHAIAFGPQT